MLKTRKKTDNEKLNLILKHSVKLLNFASQVIHLVGSSNKINLFEKQNDII